MALDQVDIEKLEEDNIKGKEMSFLDHLEALRWHIIRSVLAIVSFAIILFLFKDFTFQTVILGPKQPDFITYKWLCSLSDLLCIEAPKFELITRELGEQFTTHITVSMVLGLVLSFPYIVWEIWSFVKPGLYEKEQKAAKGLVGVASFLFFAGVLFGYFIIAPFAISFLASYSVGADVTSSPTLVSYVNYMVMFTLPTGLVFELPIIIYFLAKAGIMTPAFMRQYRRHAIVLILILAAIITPPDLITQLMIGFPLYFLYEVSILIAYRVEKNLKKEELNDK